MHFTAFRQWLDKRMHYLRPHSMTKIKERKRNGRKMLTYMQWFFITWVRDPRLHIPTKTNTQPMQRHAFGVISYRVENKWLAYLFMFFYFHTHRTAQHTTATHRKSVNHITKCLSSNLTSTIAFLDWFFHLLAWALSLAMQCK